MRSLHENPETVGAKMSVLCSFCVHHVTVSGEAVNSNSVCGFPKYTAELYIAFFWKTGYNKEQGNRYRAEKQAISEVQRRSEEMKKKVFAMLTALVLAVCMLPSTVYADRNYTGLALEEGEWIYFNEGVPDASYTGFVDYMDASYLVCNGRACTELNGLQQNPADQKFYFLAEGRLQKHTGWAEYDNHWFILKDGQPDTGQTGLVEYNGGLFAAAAGQVLTDYSGLFLNAGDGIVNPDNRWYFLSNGQVQKQYSGLALYDGHWFYVQNGMLADSLTGIVPHDGAEFYVINGEVAGDYTGAVNYAGKNYLVIKGQVDYDNGTGQKVWIDLTAAKYHLRRDCSGMDNAFQVSVEKARELGRTACKKCFK